MIRMLSAGGVMKVTAHLVVSKGYGRAIMASQWIDECLQHCEEHNAEHCGEGYLSEPKDRATITVSFDVPDSVFEREPVPMIEGAL